MPTLTRSVLGDPDGGYAAYLPAGDGTPTLMRQDDGIHFSRAGADRAAAAVLAHEALEILDEAGFKAMLAGGCVSHSYLEFYQQAIEISIEQSNWPAARRYANELAAYTAEEPLAPTTLQCDRARLLADVGENVVTSQTHDALREVRERCRRMNALALMPAVDAALEMLERQPTA